MSISVCVRLLMQGVEFSPAKLEHITGVTFYLKNEVGEIGITGRYKGQPFPFGFAAYEVEKRCSHEMLQTAGSESWCILMELRNMAMTVGAESVVLHLDIEYQSQCNFEISPEAVKSFAALGVPVTVTCYEQDDSEISEETSLVVE